MGFSVNKATRALHFSGNSTVEGAVNWLMEHEGDADLDEPLLVPKVGITGGGWCQQLPQLTPQGQSFVYMMQGKL